MHSLCLSKNTLTSAKRTLFSLLEVIIYDKEAYLQTEHEFTEPRVSWHVRNSSVTPSILGNCEQDDILASYTT